MPKTRMSKLISDTFRARKAYSKKTESKTEACKQTAKPVPKSRISVEPKAENHSVKVQHKDENQATSSTAGKTAHANNHQLLREFDLNWEYGPCVGITRLERWERAQKLGKNPPTQVKSLLLKYSADEKYTQPVWHDYAL